MRIYVMRHGQTVWNSIGRTQGRSRNMLSHFGKKQVESAAEFLKDKKIDLIISSPVFRTVQSANIVNKTLNKKIIKDERIAEIGQGIYERSFKNSLTSEEREKKALRLEEDGMESHESLFNRVKNFVEDIKIKYAGKTILIVTHAIPVEIFELILKGQQIFDKTTYETVEKVQNSEIRFFEI